MGPRKLSVITSVRIKRVFIKRGFTAHVSLVFFYFILILSVQLGYHADIYSKSPRKRTDIIPTVCTRLTPQAPRKSGCTVTCHVMVADGRYWLRVTPTVGLRRMFV